MTKKFQIDKSVQKDQFYATQQFILNPVHESEQLNLSAVYLLKVLP